MFRKLSNNITCRLKSTRRCTCTNPTATSDTAALILTKKNLKIWEDSSTSVNPLQILEGDYPPLSLPLLATPGAIHFETPLV